MPGSHPVVHRGACPKCGGDVEWDSGEIAMICQRGCGYRRDRLLPDTRDLVVVEGTPTVNGNGQHVDEYVSIQKLADRFGISVAGVKQRLTSRGLTWDFRNGESVVTKAIAEKIATLQRVPGGARAATTSKTPIATPADPQTTLPGVHPSETRQVRLRSGGTVTVTVAVPWLSLSKEDREYVFGLIDELAGYEANQVGRR